MFVAFASAFASIHLDPIRWPIPFNSDWGKRITWGEIFSNSHAYEEESTIEIPSGAIISIDNAYGTVEITAGAVEEMKVRMKKVIYEDSEPKARRIADKLRLISETEDGQLKIKTNWMELKGMVPRLDTNLVITVPQQSQCKVRNRKGAIKVSGLAGDQEIEGGNGDAQINDIKGSVRVENKNGETTLSAITGNVEAICSSSRL